jgi:2-methylcitrate dehydratase PrpD
MGLTARLAQFACQTTLGDLPPRAIATAKAGIVDCLGVMLAGSREPLASILIDVTRALGGEPHATVVGHGYKTSLPRAAMINGAMGHALDFDDTTVALKGHPSVVFLPPVLAAAEASSAGGADVLLGYAIGFEVACAVGAGMGLDYWDGLGWHPTGPLGCLGAAAGTARLLGLDEERTVTAIGIAASQASGLRENFGTMTKPLHAGHAAETGVTAALLARAGCTASPTAIEGRFGFLHAFSGGRGYDADLATARLGGRLALIDSGIAIKTYPSCGSTHAAVEALLQILRRHPIDPTEVRHVEVRVNFDPPRSLIYDHPRTPMEGRFSMQYCIATALVDRQLGLGSFTDAKLRRPETQQLMRKIQLVRHPGRAGRPSFEEPYHEVQVALGDGRVLRDRAPDRSDGRVDEATMLAIAAKYRDCAALTLSPESVESSLRLASAIETLETVTGLMDLLAGG